LDQSLNEPTASLFSILERHTFALSFTGFTGLHQTACYADSDQEHRHEDQDKHEQHMMMGLAFFLIPMNFPGNFEVARMAKHHGPPFSEGSG